LRDPQWQALPQAAAHADPVVSRWSTTKELESRRPSSVGCKNIKERKTRSFCSIMVSIKHTAGTGRFRTAGVECVFPERILRGLIPAWEVLGNSRGVAGGTRSKREEGG